MKKIATRSRYAFACRLPAQMMRIMKLLSFFLFVVTLSVHAEGTAQSITLSGKSLTMKQVFAAIEQQTGYVVFYRQNQLDKTRPVTVTVSDMPLRAFLDTVLWQQQLDFRIKDKTIILSPRASGITREQEQAIFDMLPAETAPLSVRVTDSLGQPLEGASVVLRARGANAKMETTDKFGVCKLTVNEGDEIYIRLIGYEMHKIQVTKAVLKENVVTIVLKPTVTQLQDVAISSVNTGYQRIRPEQSTGAVAQISTKEYEARISTNFLDGLVNRLPGLMINNDVTLTTSTNGTNSLFNIRGISTMSANQNPLIVIDGYPTELTINMIDPNEIKSVTILKDAAAATVYGVRASNGVIVIERKQASAGKPRFAFRATTGITPKENYSRYKWASDASSIVVNYQKDLNSRSITASTWGLLATSNTNGGTIPRSPVYYLQAQEAAKVITPDQAQKAYAALLSYDNAEEYSSLFQRAAVTQTYNLNVSGGNDNALYYVTANYTRNRLSAMDNNNNRILLSARSILKLSRRLSLELTTDYQESRYNQAPVPDVATANIYEHYLDANGNANDMSNKGVTPSYNDYLVTRGLENMRYSPVTEMKQVSNNTRTYNNRITANFRYDIGAGFDLSFGGIYETSRSDYKHLANGSSYEVRDYVNRYTSVATDGTLKFNIPKGDFLQQQASNTTSYTGRAQLNYNKKIGSLHSVNAILGAEIRKVINSSNLSSQFGYNDQTLLVQPVDYAGINTGDIQGSFGLGQTLRDAYTTLFNQQYGEDRFLSGYANIVYSFKNTYSLTGSMRIDQSNLFGTDPKYKYKPLWSVGAAWNMQNESFMQDIDWVKQLKLRLAYGFNGNVAKMSLPQVIAKSVMNTYTSSSTPALTVSAYANSSLRWEQTQNFNIGIDYRLANNISGTIDYYRKKSTDLLGNAQIDPTIGTSPSLINQATIHNNGIELSLHADWISNNHINWNTGLVLSRNTSKVLDVYRKTDYNPQTLNSLGYVKGYPVGAMFAYRYVGLDTAGYPLLANSKGKTYRTNSSLTSDPSYYYMKSDTTDITLYMGSSIPTISAGLSNRVDIGRFYVYCMINYYGGFKVRVPRPNPAASRPLEGAGNYWKTKGDEKNTDVMNLVGYTGANAVNAYNYADKYMVNGDYLTLADLTVSYSLDGIPAVKRTGFTHVEVKCQASNIWTVGLNKYNYSMATGSYQKSYITPTYTIGIFTNF